MIYIQHDSEGDTYFKALLLKQYLYKLKKKHFIDITEELKSTGS